MNVLHVMPKVSRASGGPPESLIGYVRAAQTQDIDVHVVAPTITPDDRRYLPEALPDVEFHLFASVGRHAWIVAPGLWSWVWRQGHRFDVVHIHGLFNLVSSLSARISAGREYPTVIRPFGTLSRRTFSRRPLLKKIYFRMLDRPSLKSASGLHFTTEGEREEASRLSFPLSGRSYVVPPPWQGKSVSADINEERERPTALFMARLHPIKNIRQLLAAWQLVVEELPGATLWIAGDADEEAEAYVNELREHVERLGIQDRVSFLGFVQDEEKARVLREAWAFVLPSHHENFGVAALEAIAHGLPVVISDQVHLHSFVEEHNLGCVVQRETDAIANALIATLSDTDQRRRCTDAGPRAVGETFGKERIGQQLAAMYRAVSRSGG